MVWMERVVAGPTARRRGDGVRGRPVNGSGRPWTTPDPPPLSRIRPRPASGLSTDPTATIHRPPGVNPQSCPQMWVKSRPCADAARPVGAVAAGAGGGAKPTLVPRGTPLSTERDGGGCGRHPCAIFACAERGLADAERFIGERHASAVGTTGRCDVHPVGPWAASPRSTSPRSTRRLAPRALVRPPSWRTRLVTAARQEKRCAARVRGASRCGTRLLDGAPCSGRGQCRARCLIRAVSS